MTGIHTKGNPCVEFVCDIFAGQFICIKIIIQLRESDDGATRVIPTLSPAEMEPELSVFSAY
jgi:hypothetical protein